MGRLFLSVLGRGSLKNGKYEYDKCNYRYGDFEPIPTRYIQEASIRLFCKGWDSSNGDRVRILCTEKSLGDQWNGEGHLKECLNRLKNEPCYSGLDFSNSVVEMPEGRTKAELWEIFEKILSSVDKDDEIWLDVTHGFRFIPMLVLVAVPYLRLVKNAEIQSITYGAGVVENGDGSVPILVLTDFVNLMDWTNAASNFVRFGRFDDCEKLIKSANQNILKETKGKDKEADTCRGLAIDVGNLSKGILQNRLEDAVIKGIPPETFSRIDFLAERELRIPPFRPLLSQIADKLSPFKPNSLGNVFEAVRWCLEHRCLQNGYSILYEGFILIVKEKLKRDGFKDVVDENWDAKSPNNPIGVYLRWKKDSDKDFLKLRKSMYNDKEEYAKALFTLSQKRNAFMHCGTGKDLLSEKDGDLEKILRDCCDKLEKWYKELNLEEE